MKDGRVFFFRTHRVNPPNTPRVIRRAGSEGRCTKVSIQGNLSRGSQEEERKVTLDDDSTLIEGDNRSDRQAFEEGEDGEDDEVKRESLSLPHERK